MKIQFHFSLKAIDLSIFKMTIFYHEQPQNPSRICRLFSSVVKDVFFNCHTCTRSLSFTCREEQEVETPSIYFNDELQVVSISKARAMEAKLRRKSIRWDESFSSVFYPVTLSELSVKTAKPQEKKQGKDEMKQIEQYNNKLSVILHKQSLWGQDVRTHTPNNNEDNKEEFLSAASQFSCCSSAASAASEFFSVNTSFSNSLSFKELEMFPELKRRSIFHEFSHCEGWPFGLCKRAMLLPPLPKSPSDSWSWCKGSKIRQDKLMASKTQVRS